MANKNTGVQTRVSQSAIAREINKAIEAAMAQVPELAHLTVDKRRDLAHLTAVPAEFIETAIDVWENTADLQPGHALDPDGMRETIAFAAAFESVADRLESQAERIRDTIRVRWAEAARPALLLLDSAQSLAKRNKDDAAVAEAYNRLKKARGNERGKAAGSAEETAAEEG